MTLEDKISITPYVKYGDLSEPTLWLGKPDANLRKNVIGEAMWRNVFQHNADWLRVKRTENTRTVSAGILVRYSFLEVLFGAEGDQRNKHFFEGDAAVLEGAVVILDEVVIVVGIGEEVAACGKDVGRRDVWTGQTEARRLLDFVDLAGIVGEIFADFIARVGGRVAVAYDFDRVVDADCAVVGCKDDFVAFAGNQLEELKGAGMAEP